MAAWLLAATQVRAQGGAPAPNASGGAIRADQACYDVRHYKLHIKVAPSSKSISGRLAMHADSLMASETLAVDLDDHLQVRSVSLDGATATYRFDAGRIVIHPASPLPAGQAFVVEVEYGGQPQVAGRPPRTGGFTWSETKAGLPWVATNCQGEGADLWWPCKDHPSDKPDGFDLYCTVPEGLVCASNGTLQGAPATLDGWTTFHWQTRSPIANYNVALNIAPYVRLDDTFTCVDGTVMPIAFYVLPSSKRKARRCMPSFLDHLAVFERLLGPYPFRREKYGLAETPHLGVGHQTMLAYGNGFRDEQYDWLHNRELADEWWGNLVTCRDWKDMWLHEGFGAYMQALYREIRFGRTAYAEEIHRHRTMNRAAIAPRESKDSREVYFGGGAGSDLNYKGRLVLHTLRYHLGDELFFQVLRRFAYPTTAARAMTDGSQCRFVDTEDLVTLVDELSGDSNAWFFEVYCRSAGLPRLEYAVVDGQLQLAWQTPNDLPFPMTVPLAVSGVEVRVPMPDGKGSIPIGTADYHIDPEQRLLMARPRTRR